jgi:hypothetical protein
MKEITLNHGKTALVDDDDFDELSKHNWFCSGGYAMRRSPRPEHKTILMHRVIMNTPDGMETDHINGNELDNRRMNLRNCSHASNIHNSKRPIHNTSGFKGVCIDKRCKYKKWRAQIKLNKKGIHLGLFYTAEDAARAYDNAAKKYFGEFANLNFGD